MIELYKKYEEIILYGFFGVCTTIVNILTYYVFAHIFNFSTVLSTIIAWIVGVLFAFVTNKIWVFKSKKWDKSIIVKEILSFFSCRLFTGLLDIVIMYLFVDVLSFNDMIIKIISNIIVIILNYIASKLIIFNKKDVKK